MVEDPLNLIVCGVGGQGNVLISRLIGRALVKQDYFVAIGETYGASQRGGAVMSHVRVSKNRVYGPFVPKGKAHFILSLEPLETLRMLGVYGNPNVVSVTNSHPSFPVRVLMGQDKYPDLEELKKAINELSQSAWFINATRMSIELGAPLVANMVMLGALIGTNIIPLTAQHIENAIRDHFSSENIELNLKAFKMGLDILLNHN